jgi:flagellar biosynthesis protein FlhF
VVRADGTAAPLATLAGGLAFGTTQPVRWRGQAARQAFAQASVACSAGATPLRLVVERITDARNGKLLAQRYLLASATLQAGAAQLLQWQAWRAAAQPCFRLLRDVQRELAGTGFGEAQRTASARVAQAVTTAWRLRQSDAPWAPGTRILLAQLAGRRVRADRGVPATTLFTGMGRLCALLEALTAGEAAQPAPLATAECA